MQILRYVLWCCSSICHQPFTFIQIDPGHTVSYQNYQQSWQKFSIILENKQLIIFFLIISLIKIGLQIYFSSKKKKAEWFHRFSTLKNDFKNWNYQKCAPKMILLMIFFFWKIRTMFDIRNWLLKSEFCDIWGRRSW